MLFTTGCFSYVFLPESKKKIKFIVGNETMLVKSTYNIKDPIFNFDESEIFSGEYKGKGGEWQFYWVAVKDGVLVGVEKQEEGKNKFNVAKKHRLEK
tara:strand:+ start:441 stop:731 length:291 start_codon:yes stop_codon:yes gene_type:complete